MLRRVDESCDVEMEGDVIKRSVPGCLIRNRMALDRGWWRALEAAFQLCSRPSRSMWERERNLNLLLDSLDNELSGFERRMIFTNAMGLDEA
jgi:hypothetical protein